MFERYTPEQLDSLPDFRKSIEGLIMYTGIPTLLDYMTFWNQGLTIQSTAAGSCCQEIWYKTDTL